MCLTLIHVYEKQNNCRKKEFLKKRIEREKHSFSINITFVRNYTFICQVDEVNKTITDRSGNPGYIIGKPVRAGVLVLNSTGENRSVLQESSQFHKGK
jgi:hypothetical protein